MNDVNIAVVSDGARTEFEPFLFLKSEHLLCRFDAITRAASSPHFASLEVSPQNTVCQSIFILGSRFRSTASFCVKLPR
jgi:hypothetical protein